METEIYYFSGTGNSLIVARDIAETTNGKLIPIPSVVDKGQFTTDAEVIGIVFPVYHAVFDGMPLIIERFVRKMNDIGSKYLFAVCTCKGWSRVTIAKLGEIIESRGGKLSAGFVVPMPDNSGPTSKKAQQQMFNNWKKKVGRIHQYLAARKRGKYEKNILFNLIMAPFASKSRRVTLELLRKLSNEADLPFEELLPLTDKSFIAREKCNGCGICARVCPVGDIMIVDDRPVWQNKCESCLACVNWCPKEAILGGIISADKNLTKYHHPDVKVSDILWRRD